jgi:tetratricopeptide (TPR) repeat protein
MQSSARVRVVVALFTASRAIWAQSPSPSFAALSTEAQTARDAHQLEKAVDLYKKALKLKPNWEDGLWSLGSMAYDLNQYRDCIWAFGKLLDLKPDSTPGWTMAGLCEYELYNYGLALDDFTQAEQLGFNENIELARTGRLHFALALTRTGNFENAVSILTELARTDRTTTPEMIVAAGIAGLRRPWLPPEVPEAQRDLVYRLGDAMISGARKNLQEAGDKFGELVKAYPSEPEIHFRYGSWLSSAGDNRGIDELKKAVALAPNHVPTLVGLSALSLNRGDAKTAVEYGEEAVKASPEDFATHLILGRALLASEEPARAATELEQAVKLAPNSAQAHYNLAEAYNHLGKKTDAVREQAEFKRLEHPGGKQIP